MAIFIRNQFKKEFVRNTLTLVTGTTVAQALSILSTPFLTRIYSPSDFGDLALVTAIITVLSVIVTARYELAIMLPAKDECAANLVVLSSLVSTFISLLILIAIYLFKNPIVLWLGEGIAGWLYLIPASIFCIGIYQSLNYWNNRKKKFKRLALGSVCQTSTGVGSQVLFGMNSVPGGLIWGSFAGQLLSTAFLVQLSWKSLKIFISRITRARVIENAIIYRRFPMFSIWGAFLDTGASQMPIFILNRFFSSMSVGFFGFTFRVLNLPISLVSSSLTQVLLQRIIEINHRNPGDLKNYIWKIFTLLSLLTVPFILIVWLFGEHLFALVFGETWREAGKLASIISIAVAARFIVGPLSAVFTLQHNLRLGTLWQLIYFVTISTTLFFARRLPMQSFLRVFALHEVCLYLLYFKFILIGSSRMENNAQTAQ